MVRCPYCGYDGKHTLLKTWRYRWWLVYFYECPNCGKKFRYQVDVEGKRRSYVMRVSRLKK